MGKSKGKISKKNQPKTSSYSDISEDEIDKHYNEREKVLLDDSEGDMQSAASDYDDALMDLPSSEEDVDEEYSEDDIFYEDEQEEEGQDEKWGKSKKAFYSADLDAIDEEAAEAKKLQKKRLESMKLEDFGISSTKKVRKSGPITLDIEEVEEGEEADNNDEDEECKEFELTEEQVAELSNEEKIELLSKHSDEFRALVQDFQRKLEHLEGHLQPLMNKVSEFPTSEGLSFLSVKYQLLTAYCTNVAFYLQIKLTGRPIQNHPVLERLVRFRLLLEKIKPMETKLRYQVDRLLRAATGPIDDVDAEASKFKPNPDLLMKDEDENSEDVEEGDGTYRAPKLAPMHYPEDENALARRKKHEDYLKKVNSSTRLIQDIKAEYEDAPEEEALDVVYGSKSRPGRREQIERDQYEEENFVRFTLDKKTKRRLAEKNKAIDELEDLNDFINEIDGPKKTNKRALKSVEMPAVPMPAKKQKKHEAFEDESDIEDDYYQLVKEQKQQKQASRKKPNKETAPVKFRPLVDMKNSKDRPANWAMMKNKGLTANRPKDKKNPRVRQRMKFEKAEKRLGSFRAVNKAPNSKYGGEDTGIRTNIVRSTKF